MGVLLFPVTMISAESGAPFQLNPGSRIERDTLPETDSHAERILNLHQQARGNEHNLRNVQSLRLRGNLEFGSHRYQYEVFKAFSSRMIRDWSRNYQGWHFHQRIGCSRTEAWEQSLLPETRNPQDLEGTAALLVRQEADILGPLIFYREKGHRFYYKGVSRIGDRPAYHLEGILANGQRIGVDIDQQTFHLLNKTMTIYHDGLTVKVDRLPLGLRRVDGVWWETGFDYRQSHGSLRRVQFETIEVNPEFDPFDFVRPPNREIWTRGR